MNNTTLTLTGYAATMPSDNGSRRYITVNCSYEEIRGFIRAHSYDHEAGEGYQRTLDKSHVNDLITAMRNGRYVPTMITTTVKPDHMRSTNISNGTMSIVVAADNPLDLVDGQHRIAAYEKLYGLDPEKWGSASVPLVVLLDADHLASDFIGLQMGKSVNKSLLESLKNQGGLHEPSIADAKRFANEVVVMLIRGESFIRRNVSHDKNDKRRMQIHTLVHHGGSTLPTTVYGGARIAKQFNKSPEWLADRYIEAYRGLLTYCEPLNPAVPNGVRKAFDAGMLLEPLMNGGTRAGSHLLIGICNMYAWRLASQGKDEGTVKDLQNLAEAVDSMFGDREFDGGSVSSKREHMGEFASIYFDNLFIDKVEGVPAELMLVMPPGSLNVSTAAWKTWKKENGVKKKEDVKPAPFSIVRNNRSYEINIEQVSVRTEVKPHLRRIPTNGPIAQAVIADGVRSMSI